MKRHEYTNKSYVWHICSAFIGLIILLSSCTSNIPDDLDALSDDITVTTRDFSPYLGRKTAFEDVVNVSNKSTLPLDFRIAGIRTAEGRPAPELLESYPVKVWTQAYTGRETSIAEIEAKRKEEYRPMFEIQQKSGNLTFWNVGSSATIETLPSEGYLFDIELSNTGGRRYVRDLVLQPRKERDYEPSQYDDINGLARTAFLRPNMLVNVVGDRTGLPILDTRVYIFKDEENTDPGNTLSISALDSLGNTIDIQKFKDTDFEHLVHGFNHRFVDGKVVYDVAYPMPLVNFPTRYTNSGGDRASLLLRYDRIGRNGILNQAWIRFEFAIFREGHWEIQIRFNGETPKFENER
ncbi:MAG TPA: DUF5007 domain-containing protein [Sphingobacterium sp.]|nr:DUF5007 domain-containing protein [Sphingobacterium sp.]